MNNLIIFMFRVHNLMIKNRLKHIDILNIINLTTYIYIYNIEIAFK